MSDSNQTIIALRQAAQNDLAKAQATHANLTYLLDALPEGTPAPESINDFGYCAEGSMRFTQGSQALFERLLELYPPQPLVKLYGDSQTIKPAAYVRENEQRWAVLDIYPVVQVDESIGGRTPRLAARWWTSVGGKSVEVKVAHAATVQVLPAQEAEKYESHGEFYLRKLAEPAIRPCSLTAWTDAWEAFSNDSGYRANQRPFLMALKHQVLSVPNKVWTDADLPEPHYLPKPGAAVAVVEGTSVTATLVALNTLKQRELAREAHAFDRMGDFRELFTPQQVEQLLTFVEKQRLALPDALKATQDEFDIIERAYRSFFATRGAPCELQANVTNRKLFNHIREITGLSFKQAWVQRPWGTRAVRAASIRICLEDRDHFRDFEAPCVQGERLLPQDVPARYVD